MKIFREKSMLGFLFLYLKFTVNTNIINVNYWNLATRTVNYVTDELKSKNILLQEDQLVIMKIYYYCRLMPCFVKNTNLNVMISKNFEGYKINGSNKKNEKVIIQFCHYRNSLNWLNHAINMLLSKGLNKFNFLNTDELRKDLCSRYNYNCIKKDLLLNSQNIIVKDVNILDKEKFTVKVFDRIYENKVDLDYYEFANESNKIQEKEVNDIIKNFFRSINDDVKSKIIRNLCKHDKKTRVLNEYACKKIIRSLLMMHIKLFCNKIKIIFNIITIFFDKDFNITIITDKYIFIDKNFKKINNKSEILLIAYNDLTYSHAIIENIQKNNSVSVKKIVLKGSYIICSYILYLLHYFALYNENINSQKFTEMQMLFLNITNNCNISNKINIYTLCKRIWNFLHNDFFKSTLLCFNTNFVDMKSIKISKNLIFINNHQSIFIENKILNETLKLTFNEFYKKFKNENINQYSHLCFELHLNEEKIEPDELGEEKFKELKSKIEEMAGQCDIPDIIEIYEGFKKNEFCHLSDENVCETHLLFNKSNAYYHIAKVSTNLTEIKQSYRVSKIDIKFFKDPQIDVEEVQEVNFYKIKNFIDKTRRNIESNISNHINKYFYSDGSKKEDNNFLEIPVFFTYVPFLGIKINTYDEDKDSLESLYYISKFEFLMDKCAGDEFNKIQEGMEIKNRETPIQLLDRISDVPKIMRMLKECETLQVIIEKEVNVNAIKCLLKSAFENSLNMFERMISIKNKSNSERNEKSYDFKRESSTKTNQNLKKSKKV